MAVKRIFSAGGIVLRRAKEPKGQRAGGFEVLVTQHSGHKGWDFPKGHVETGETSKEAALREVLEETGVKGEILEKVGDTKYFYYEKDKPSFAKATEDRKVFKTVNYFLMKYVGEGKATTAFEVSAKKWLKPEEVDAQLTFDSTKKLWKKVEKKVKSLS